MSTIEEASNQQTQMAINIQHENEKFITVFGMTMTPSTWEHFTINVDVEPDFKQKISDYLTSKKPHPSDVYAALSGHRNGGRDFHLYIKPGNTAKTWNMDYRFEGPNLNSDLISLLSTSNAHSGIRPIGFNFADHNAIWFLTYK